MPIPEDDDNISENFEPYKDEKFTLEEQNIEGDYINLVGKSLDIGSHARNGLSRCIL